MANGQTTEMAKTPEQTEAEKRAAGVETRQKEIDTEVNAKRSGKTTFVRVGLTRGKNPQRIEFEVFDSAKVESLPASIDEFISVLQSNPATKDTLGDNPEPAMLAWLMDGFNSASYSNASDPSAEFVNPVWPDAIQKQFRAMVRGLMAAKGIGAEEAAGIIRPGLDLAFTPAK